MPPTNQPLPVKKRNLILLENLVKITRKDPASTLPARSYEDYTVEIDIDKLPKNVTCKRFVDPYAEIDSFRF